MSILWLECSTDIANFEWKRDNNSNIDLTSIENKLIYDSNSNSIFRLLIGMLLLVGLIIVDFNFIYGYKSLKLVPVWGYLYITFSLGILISFLMLIGCGLNFENKLVLKSNFLQDIILTKDNFKEKVLANIWDVQIVAKALQNYRKSRYLKIFTSSITARGINKVLKYMMIISKYIVVPLGGWSIYWLRDNYMFTSVNIIYLLFLIYYISKLIINNRRLLKLIDSIIQFEKEFTQNVSGEIFLTKVFYTEYFQNIFQDIYNGFIQKYENDINIFVDKKVNDIEIFDLINPYLPYLRKMSFNNIKKFDFNLQSLVDNCFHIDSKINLSLSFFKLKDNIKFYYYSFETARNIDKFKEDINDKIFEFEEERLNEIINQYFDSRIKKEFPKIESKELIIEFFQHNFEENISKFIFSSLRETICDKVIDKVWKQVYFKFLDEKIYMYLASENTILFKKIDKYINKFLYEITPKDQRCKLFARKIEDIDIEQIFQLFCNLGYEKEYKILLTQLDNSKSKFIREYIKMIKLRENSLEKTLFKIFFNKVGNRVHASNPTALRNTRFKSKTKKRKKLD